MKQKLMQALSLLSIASIAFSASAANKYWDTNSDTAGFGTAGGTWGIDTNWSADATGTAVPDVTDTTVDDDLFFGSANIGLEAGTVTVDSTNQAFRTLTFGAASGPITIAGGALKMAAPASRITVNSASNTIASILAGTNGLRKYTLPTLSYTNFLTETTATLFPNANLTDYANAGGILWGASIARVPANAYFFTNDGATATFQLQTTYGADTVCLKVAMAQAGANIEGSAVYAKRIAGHQLGYDFDQEVNTADIATATNMVGYGVSQTLLLSSTQTHEPFLTMDPTLVLKDVSLSEISSVAASMAGDSVSTSPVPTTPYYFQNNGSTCTVQMQAFNGEFTKCVKVELTQSNADVVGRVMYTKYFGTQGSNRLGFDFDTDGETLGTATTFTAGGYGICQLRFPHKLTLTGVNTYTGSTTIDDGGLEIAGAGSLGGGAYTGAIVNASQLVFNSTASQTLAGKISGVGSLIKTSPEKAIGTLTYPVFLTTQMTLIFPNASLADCTAVDGVLGGWAVNRTPPNPDGLPLPADAYHFTNDGTNASWQLQAIDGAHTKCVKVAATQTAGGISARAVYAKYLLNTQNLGFDFDSGGEVQNSIATSYGGSGYGVAETAITLYRHSSLILAGTNTYSGGTMVNTGALFATGSANSLPSSGSIVVNGGGNLTLGVLGMGSGNAGGVGNGNPITVNSGGTLTLSAGFNAGYSRRITLDGGTLNCVYLEFNDSANYINNMVLMNGARVIGNKVRVGYLSPANITVAGTSPSYLEAGLTMANQSNRALTLDVANVTDDDAVDFFIPGVIRDYNAALSGTPIIKIGDGTASFSGANTFTGMVTVTKGTVALAANNTFNPDNNIVLNGGTFDMGAFTNTVGRVTISTNSVIALGDGRLSFADSSAVTWTNNATLTLTGTLGPQSVRFGVNDSALTTTQISAISYNGQSVRLRSDGYLSPWARGTIILVW